MQVQGGEPPYARDAETAWLKAEFAAANAIIDVLCGHLRWMGGDGNEYDEVFQAIHRRRINWMPVINMQRFFSIAEVSFELQRVADGSHRRSVDVVADGGGGGDWCRDDDDPKDHLGSCSPAVQSSNGGSSQEDHSSSVEETSNVSICSNHEYCASRRERINISKGFVVKEQMKGHMVNVVKGLKVFEHVFEDPELTKLSEFINDLRVAGRNGELSGETFVFYNKEVKGNKREMIQLGAPIFQHTIDGEEADHIEPIPSILQDVIDHLVLWRLISPSKKPNSCFINFFNEGEYSQPYSKPPHLDHPISTLVLCETSMAFGRSLASDPQGNYTGSLTLNLKQGSVVVMRGQSADVARHVVCPSESSRVTITFAKVRHNPPYYMSHQAQATPCAWGMALPLQAPFMMVPPPPLPVEAFPDLYDMGIKKKKSNGRSQCSGNGTGVFLPWNSNNNKYIRQLPPRIQRRRLLPSLPPLIKMQVDHASPSPPSSSPVSIISA